MKKVNRNDMIYHPGKELFNFKTFKTIRSLGKNIYIGRIAMNEADQEQDDLLEHILNFNNKARYENKDDKKKKIIIKEMFLILQKFFMKVENQLSMPFRADYFH